MEHVLFCCHHKFEHASRASYTVSEISMNRFPVLVWPLDFLVRVAYQILAGAIKPVYSGWPCPRITDIRIEISWVYPILTFFFSNRSSSRHAPSNLFPTSIHALCRPQHIFKTSSKKAPPQEKNWATSTRWYTYALLVRFDADKRYLDARYRRQWWRFPAQG